MTEREEMLDLAEWARATAPLFSAHAAKYERMAEILEGIVSPAQGRPHPEVVAAVQEAIMRHPFWKPGLGSSGFAFGLANTAIDAYLAALSSTDGNTP